MGSIGNRKVIALAGGVGGARFANGLIQTLSPEQLTIVVNVGDDFELLNLKICPDLDTVMYTAAGLNDLKRGWGLANESWQFMKSLEKLGGPTWFQLGDQDMATQVKRTALLSCGLSLSEVTYQLCKALGIGHHIVPASDQMIQTRLITDVGELAFQDYFVRQQCLPKVSQIKFDGASEAKANQHLMQSLSDQQVAGVIIGPSNPLLSIEPILAIPELQSALRHRQCPCIAISPIIAGQVVKGPLAKIMGELGKAVNPLEIAHLYHGFIDGLIIDDSDQQWRSDIQKLGIQVMCTDILMRNHAQQASLAKQAVEWFLNV